MRKGKFTIVVALLLTFSVTLIAPMTSAYAFSLSDITGAQNTNIEKSSNTGNSLINIILGLLLGKLLGNINNNDDVKTTPNVTLGSTNQIKNGSLIVNTAQKYMGIPYVWGGMSTSGFDCSGFTQYVMKQHLITIPRTAAEQFGSGRAVNDTDLAVGDLVFFTTYKPGASHVGFYLGEDKFVHASSVAKQVTISSLQETYYKEHYIGARRYI